ncbi:hypothetical protein PR202_ga02951 [Eleusine coracana subsp. coracana]|uniref:Uncharacterized protein n=1 Tax=Eleusine coracana subsp. coracana TaxID=191504 RepID=A0AAV5BMT2_ELECO|nr:hypothetical protein PR202_ga02951 [Eleusine coracana subsp. coracana]
MSRFARVFCCLMLAAVATAAAAAETQAQSSYIVHVAPAHAPRSSRPRLLARAYTSFLRDTLPASMSHPEPTMLYSYAHAATGFAARLTKLQAAHLESQRSVLAVVPDKMLQLHTTLTPSFLGLSGSYGLLPASNGAEDVVIGVIDTGIYPIDRASFAAADQYLSPPPTKFRGSCVSTPAFNASAYCNNKLVGAKFFSEGYEAESGGFNETEESKSPLDTHGHGTHTASTAAGSAVSGAAFFNYGRGEAVGMAPGARIAAYKACWKNGCTDSDILAAFDAAIADGVDVISFSIGAVGEAPEFYNDTTAIGAFRAVRKGIVVSASAGNSGPDEFTVVNTAPWILTVGASTVNRRYPAKVVLGNGKRITGVSLYAGKPLNASEKIPLVYGGDAGSNVCQAGKLNASLVAGKIVLCDPGLNPRAAKGEAVKLAGGAGAILSSTKEFGEMAMAGAHVLPAAAITFAAAEKIKKYISSTEAEPVAKIVFRGTVVGETPSSREWRPSRAAAPTSARLKSSSRTSPLRGWTSSRRGQGKARPPGSIATRGESSTTSSPARPCRART